MFVLLLLLMYTKSYFNFIKTIYINNFLIKTLHSFDNIIIFDNFCFKYILFYLKKYKL